MHLQYGTTTVSLDGAGIKATEVKDEDSSRELHKTLSRKTAAAYATAAKKDRFALSCALVAQEKRDELYALWALSGGPQDPMTYRDKSGTDYTVYWMDDSFSLTAVSHGLYEGTITLEKAI